MPRAKDAKAHKRSASKSQSTPVPSSPRQQQQEQVKVNATVLPTPTPEEEVTYLRILVSIVKASATLAVLPFVSISIQIAMQPLYGSAPTMYQIRNMCLAAAMLSGVLPSPGEGSIFPNESVLSGVVGILLIFAPNLYYWIGVLTSRAGSPLWGPIATHAILTAPIIALTSLMLRYFMTRASKNPPPFAMVTPLLGWNFVQGVEPLYWDKFKFGDPFNSTTIFTAVGTLAIINAVITPVPKPTSQSGKVQVLSMRRKGYGALMGLITVGLGIYSSLQLQARRFPIGSNDGSHQLLASSTGRHGLVTVGENKTEGYRYLRAGHSLLGGLWILEKASIPVSETNPLSQLMPTKLGDSIYSAFVLQEGVRLFKPSASDADQESHKEKVLIIGLGAGVAARAMNEHGMDLTIVEIDPLVYKYARQYFGMHRLRLPEEGDGLGDDGEVWIRDARGWVHDTVVNGTSVQFDYIIHDVFSGGTVPGHIFTLEFLQELKVLLRKDGVLALNFAGTLGTPASRSILTTLLHVFPGGTCKAYHDDLEPESGEGEAHHRGNDDFFNMVFFCADFPDLNPRAGKKADYLDSPLREHILSTIAKREVPKSTILGNVSETVNGEVSDWILRDKQNQLGEWQSKTAMQHWKIMRNVLPNAIWETY